MHPTPPRLANGLLQLFLGAEDFEIVAGDLEEQFHTDLVPSTGVRAARAWYWRQVVSVIGGRLVNLRQPRMETPRPKGSVMAATRQDLSYALRSLRKQPGFTAVAVLTLALGIGANVAIFSLVHAVLFKTLPFREPGRLMLVHLLVPERDAPGVFRNVVWSYPKYQSFREQQRSFESTALFVGREWNLTGSDAPERLPGEFVDASYFDVLGVAPHVGRTFSAEETRAPGSPPTVILGYGLWTRRFGADPGVLGKTIGLNAVSHTIVGVLPPSFRGLSGQAEVWIPLMTLPASDINEVWSHVVSSGRSTQGRRPGRAGAGRGHRARRPPRRTLPGHARRYALGRGGDAARRRARRSADSTIGAADARCRRVGAAHRLRQPRQPDAGTRPGASTRSRDQARPGRQPGSNRPSVDDREPSHRVRRRTRRSARRVWRGERRRVGHARSPHRAADADCRIDARRPEHAGPRRHDAAFHGS